ncbi:DNA double-strand break repair nuclease NurA [Caldicellulosiruptor naganoensis]|uniref:DNA double-strand break repair nuclease NurA n=1 Tax=Caldicellulosiruptor naganoensis TaxID=29324 RepID=A0ABY7BIP2_9FIRM|nr:DNA double-strand break repair nuclease NurA [Caldicellulosiruptor naganoensis]WAM30901.1 DNA double-strand break repair nuclease NurA [Caldicellulosiruptor naganoensis]
MLDFHNLVQQINEKKSRILEKEREIRESINEVSEFLYSLDDKKIEKVLSKIPRKDEKNEILFCLPYYSNFNEFMRSFPCEVQTSYEVFAVDGSNTEIDRHISQPYYLLNIACVEITYDSKNSNFNYKTQGYIYLDEELYSRKEAQAIKNSSEISRERQAKEYMAILEYVENSLPKDSLRLVLYDGNLIDWTQDRQGLRFGRKANPELEKIFNLAKQKNIAVCGFISMPKNSIISNLYRIYNCAKMRIDCKECSSYEKRNCEKVERIRDVFLFSHLKTGQHSNVFYTLGRAFDEFEDTDIAFVYLQTGYEVARIEIPLYVAKDQSWLKKCIGAIYHQCQIGFGYPISLTHAHEFSTISYHDKMAIENMLVDFGEDILPYSAKKSNKMKRIV